MKKLQLKSILKPFKKDVVSVCDLTNKIAILLGLSPFNQEIQFYNTKLYKYLFKLKQISSNKIAKVVSMKELKTHDLAYSTYESGEYGIEIFIYKVYDNSYTLINRLCQKTTKEKYPAFLNLMDGSFLTYIDYIQLFHKKNKPFGNFFNHMLNTFLPYKFSLGKKIQPVKYGVIYNIIETKPYEVVFYIYFYIYMNYDTLTVYDLKKENTIQKINAPGHNFAYFLSKYKDKFLIAKFSEKHELFNYKYDSYLFFYDINNKYEFVSKIKFNETHLFVNNKYNNRIISYFSQFKEWEINKLNINLISDCRLNHFFLNKSYCIITKTNNAIFYSESEGIFIYEYIKQ